ncbi:hypothetical protein C8R43DRAFT_1123528 [Mycena crocata]|nr:hypothetical protein C8R43DRAFT_1123528 [Mycena crocata]
MPRRTVKKTPAQPPPPHLPFRWHHTRVAFFQQHLEQCFRAREEGTMKEFFAMILTAYFNKFGEPTVPQDPNSPVPSELPASERRIIDTTFRVRIKSWFHTQIIKRAHLLASLAVRAFEAMSDHFENPPRGESSSDYPVYTVSSFRYKSGHKKQIRMFDYVVDECETVDDHLDAAKAVWDQAPDQYAVSAAFPSYEVAKTAAAAFTPERTSAEDTAEVRAMFWPDPADDD